MEGKPGFRFMCLEFPWSFPTTCIETMNPHRHRTIIEFIHLVFVADISVGKAGIDCLLRVAKMSYKCVVFFYARLDLFFSRTNFESGIRSIHSSPWLRYWAICNIIIIIIADRMEGIITQVHFMLHKQFQQDQSTDGE